MEWIEEPVDKKVKAGKCDEATFTAKLSVKGKKAKWYIRNQVREFYPASKTHKSNTRTFYSFVHYKIPFYIRLIS